MTDTNASAASAATQTTGAQAPQTTPSSAMPAVKYDANGVAMLPSITALSDSVYSELSPEQQKVADEVVRTYDFKDPLKVVRFGEVQMSDAVKAAEAMANRTKVMECGKAGDLMLEVKGLYEELGVGGIHPRWWHTAFKKVGLGKFADPLAGWLDQHSKMGPQLQRLFDAQLDEAAGLEDQYKISDTIRGDNMQAFDNYGVAIGAAEEALKKIKVDFEVLAAKYGKSTDPGKLDLVEDEVYRVMFMNDKTNALKVGRIESLKSARTLKQQMRVLLMLINQIRNTQGVMKQIWLNQVAIAVNNYKISRATMVVRRTREVAEKLMSVNTEDLQKAVTEAFAEQAKGVFDVGIIEGLINRDLAFQDQVHNLIGEVLKTQEDAGKRLDALAKLQQEKQQTPEQLLARLKRS